MGAETVSYSTLAIPLEPQGVNPPPAPVGRPSYPHQTNGYDKSDGIEKAAVGEGQESLQERFSKMPLTELVGRFEGIHARLQLLDTDPNPNTRQEWESEIAQFNAAMSALINYPTTHPKMSSDEQIAYKNVFLAVRDGLVPLPEKMQRIYIPPRQPSARTTSIAQTFRVIGPAAARQEGLVHPVQVHREPDDTRNTERQQELEARYQKIKEIYISFRQKNHFDQRPLGGNPLERARTPEEMQVLSNSLQQEIARALGVEQAKIEKMRHIDPNAVQEFAFLMRDGGTVLMRHGPQDSHATKIDQMSPPDNMNDPATLEGLTEFAATLLAIEYTLDTMVNAHSDQKIKLRIKSSPNQRALDIANVIGAVFNSRVERDSRLKCMDYRKGIQHGDPDLNEDDSVDWEEGKINRVFGPHAYSHQREWVQQLTEEGNRQEPQSYTMTLMITHTQTTNAADELGHNTPTRYANFGARIYPAGNSFASFRMSDGVYQPKSDSVSPKTSLQPDTQATHGSDTA